MENINLATVEFVEKIEELVNGQKEEFEQVDVLGKTLVNKKWIEVQKNTPSPIPLNSLKSTITFIKTTIKNNNCNLTLPLIIESSHTDMYIRTSLAEDTSRVTLAQVSPTIPNICFGSFMDIQKFIIQLQTCFKDTENKSGLLENIKFLSTESKVETIDNGISQTVTATQGTALKKEINVPPIARLVAYRTYNEVEQPETMYLLRARDGGELALFEADGGSWKHESQRRVSTYLCTELAEEIKEGTVVVLG